MAIEQYYFLGATATDTAVEKILDRKCSQLGFLKHDGTTGTLYVKLNDTDEFIQLKAGESIGDKDLKVKKFTYKAGSGESVAFRILMFLNDED